jgi:A/G-specific adenine glycosylase
MTWMSSPAPLPAPLDADTGARAAEAGRAAADWYRAQARDLPWRSAGVSPWGVLVSEFMLQQTQVSRVLPRWAEWMRRWPTPAALAAAPPDAVIRAWGRLGYPRRARWLHQCARAIRDEHDNVVPCDPAVLRTLPGVGPYTAAAVAAFAYQVRVPVVDTNVRRVLTRSLRGVAAAPPSRADEALAARALPADGAGARIVSLGLMELGALVCTSRAPRCSECPLSSRCRWLAAGCPASPSPRRPQPRYEGSHRQARGLVLARLREGEASVPELLTLDADPALLSRALTSLIADGLATQDGDQVALPRD